MEKGIIFNVHQAWQYYISLFNLPNSIRGRYLSWEMLMAITHLNDTTYVPISQKKYYLPLCILPQHSPVASVCFISFTEPSQMNIGHYRNEARLQFQKQPSKEGLKLRAAYSYHNTQPTSFLSPGKENLESDRSYALLYSLSALRL